MEEVAQPPQILQSKEQIIQEIKDNFNKFMLTFNPNEADYQLDELQNRMLEFYLANDRKFRRSYHVNFTDSFIIFLKDKVRLKEPFHVAVQGLTRCQKKGSKVLMSNGDWKSIEDIKIGDKVLSPQKNGKNVFSKVKGIYQGYSDRNYEVYEKNGKKRYLFNCSSNHQIPTFFYKYKGTARDKTKKLTGKDGIAEYTADCLSKMNHRNHRLITSFSINKFEGRKNCLINPYFLGVYLGDGCFTKSLILANSYKGILKKINPIYKVLSIGRKGKENSYINTRYSLKSRLAKLLIKYGLRYKRSGDKFIPKEALLSDIFYRRKLLAGLIDTDGYLSKELAYSITTKSKQLANDILCLVRSLGGNGSITKIKKGIRSTGFVGKYFHVSFYLGKEIENIKLYRDNKKRREGVSYWKKTTNRISFILKKSKRDIVYGIEVDSLSRYYVTDNFVVTHNSGKSSVTSTICFIMMAMGGKLFSVEPYITANNIEFLEKVNSLSMEDVGDTIFQIDEEKSYFGLGSNAKKFKLQDVQNIIAKANISTASLCPTKFSNENAHYGLRTFGRCFKTKTVRLMLYNLQEGGKGGTLPLGMVYLPIPCVILPEGYFRKFDGEYQSKKDIWIQDERRGKTDVMGELKRRTAQSFMNDEQFLKLKKKDEKITYIRMKLGAEWTVGETLEIYNITKLYSQGINLDR